MSNAINGGMLVPEPAMAQMMPTGTYVDLLDPDPATINPEDIAHHSGMTARYGGGVRRFYSVAEHAILVADLLLSLGCSNEMARGGLLHDGAEAYIGDMISPAKYAMRVLEARRSGQAEQFRTDNGAWFDKPPRSLRGVFSELGEKLDIAIGKRFDIDHELFDHPTVKTADMWALKIEAAELTYSRGECWRWPGELPNGGRKPSSVGWAGGLAWESAAALWLGYLERLS